MKNLSSRRYCLDCSPWGLHNTRPIEEAKSDKFCARCEKRKPLSDFYKRRRGPNDFTPYCRTCHNAQTVKRQQRLKKMAVDYKGGCCQSCGYSKYVGALEFHHSEPEHKDFGIARFNRTSFSERIKKELDKCILLCANCHRETHARQKGLIE